MRSKANREKLKMRFVGVSGSTRPDRTTSTLVQHGLKEMEAQIHSLDPDAEVETVFIPLSGKNIRPCQDCWECTKQGRLCVLDDDWLELAKPLFCPAPPDGILIGSPVSCHSINAQLKAYMERCTCLLKSAWHPGYPIPIPDFGRTIGGAISVGSYRNGGQEDAINAIISFYLTYGFLVAGSFSPIGGPIGYTGGAGWAGAPGVDKEHIEVDSEGMLSVKALSEKIARSAYAMRVGLNNIE